MSEQTMLRLAKERQQNLCAEAYRLQSVPRPGKGFWVGLLGKLPFAWPGARFTLAASAC